MESPAAPDRVEVLVLGLYHMNNPGRDVFNTEAGDVLAPERQAEIAQVIATLKEFRPTKIAVEVEFNDNGVAKRYADYVAGTYDLTRSETEQLGFRLARELGHATVFPVDVGGDFPFPRVVKYAQATDRVAEFEALQQEMGRKAEAQSEYLASHTVLETLLYMNADGDGCRARRTRMAARTWSRSRGARDVRALPGNGDGNGSSPRRGSIGIR